jgi:isopenicillin N synthase-like dioxygenase
MLLDEIPSLDLADFKSTDPTRKAKFVQELGNAFNTIGFVAIKGHGLSESFTQSLYQEVETFFKSWYFGPTRLRGEGERDCKGL